MQYYGQDTLQHILERQGAQLSLTERLERDPIPIEEVEVLHFIGVDLIPQIDPITGEAIVRVNEVNGLDSGTRGGVSIPLSSIYIPEEFEQTMIAATDCSIDDARKRVMERLFSPEDLAIASEETYNLNQISEIGIERDIFDTDSITPEDRLYATEEFDRVNDERLEAVEKIIERQQHVTNLLANKNMQYEVLHEFTNEFIETHTVDEEVFAGMRDMSPINVVVVKPNIHSSHGEGIEFLREYDPVFEQDNRYTMQPYIPSVPIPNPDNPDELLASNIRWGMFIIKLSDGSEYFTHIGGYNRTLPYIEGEPVKINVENPDNPANPFPIPDQFVAPAIRASEKVGNAILDYIENTPIESY